MPSVVEEFLSAFRVGLQPIIEELLGEFIESARTDAEAFISESWENLAVWLEDLRTGALAKDEFEFLLRGQEQLMRMKLLRQAGVAAARLERFRQAVIDLAIRSALSVVPI